PNTAARIVGRKSLGDETVREEAVDWSVDIQIDAEVEVMIVIHRNEVLIHEATVSITNLHCGVPRTCSGWPIIGSRHSRGLHFCNACGPNRHAYRSILLESPIENVIVVAQHGRATHYQIALTAAFRILREMPPGHVARLALEDTNDIGYSLGPSLVGRN